MSAAVALLWRPLAWLAREAGDLLWALLALSARLLWRAARPWVVPLALLAVAVWLASGGWR